MNDPQRQLLASAVSLVLLVIVFLCPWRVESTGEVKWSPIYQQPLVFVRSFDQEIGSRGGYEIQSEQAQIAYGLLALEILAVGMAGTMGYYFLDSKDDRKLPHAPDEFSKTGGVNE